MDDNVTTHSKISSVVLILVSVLLLSFHFFFVYFINSTYISAIVGDTGVSVIYGIGAAFNILLFLKAPKMLRRYGLVNMTIGLAFMEIVALVILAFPIHPVLLLIAFFMHIAAAPLLIYCMDMFLEQYGPKEQTGSIRGMFLSIWNLPTVITPFIVGLILANTTNAADMAIGAKGMLASLRDAGYWKIYLISAIFLIPFLVILKSNFGKNADPAYPDVRIMDTFMHFLKHKNVFDVFIDRLLLNLFFAWSAIYLPIYLHEFIGFSWNQVGILLVMTALPFVLFQGRIGRMQDQRSQEKTLLIAGFLIMAIGSIMVPFLTAKSIVSWAILLFITYTGASMVEVSSESYFFKHVSPTNSGFISIFRMTRAMPYLVIPLAVAFILAFMPFNYIFLVLGLIMLLGIRYAFLIR